MDLDEDFFDDISSVSTDEVDMKGLSGMGMGMEHGMHMRPSHRTGDTFMEYREMPGSPSNTDVSESTMNPQSPLHNMDDDLMGIDAISVNPNYFDTSQFLTGADSTLSTGSIDALGYGFNDYAFDTGTGFIRSDSHGGIHLNTNTNTNGNTNTNLSYGTSKTSSLHQEVVHGRRRAYSVPNPPPGTSSALSRPQMIPQNVRVEETSEMSLDEDKKPTTKEKLKRLYSGRQKPLSHRVSPGSARSGSSTGSDDQSSSLSESTLPPGFKYGTDPSGVEWTEEEQEILEENLPRHMPNSKEELPAFIKVAFMLPNKSVRDVANRYQWMEKTVQDKLMKRGLHEEETSTSSSRRARSSSTSVVDKGVKKERERKIQDVSSVGSE
eukprot:TRINITY_DN5555_c0_g1_i1.p1 TRINITY_DN5555_c0_g1~~TRINITY_DN5555_c0_g1_i1.p1  ORF type:complete len:380 (-),score=104.06 TRINITY_DN5555_c0_g1_i1:30-1169(-)